MELVSKYVFCVLQLKVWLSEVHLCLVPASYYYNVV